MLFIYLINQNEQSINKYHLMGIYFSALPVLSSFFYYLFLLFFENTPIFFSIFFSKVGSYFDCEEFLLLFY